MTSDRAQGYAYSVVDDPGEEGDAQQVAAHADGVHEQGQQQDERGRHALLAKAEGLSQHGDGADNPRGADENWPVQQVQELAGRSSQVYRERVKGEQVRVQCGVEADAADARQHGAVEHGGVGAGRGDLVAAPECLTSDQRGGDGNGDVDAERATDEAAREQHDRQAGQFPGTGEHGETERDGAVTASGQRAAATGAPADVRNTRSPKARVALVLPPCPVPRPGEAVTWYEAARREVGVLTGHSGTGQPIVKGEFDREYQLSSFQALRILDPFQRRGPTWDQLPDTALWEPSESEAASFAAALSTKIPLGHQYMDLVEEIWSRGFEVFLVGGTVRDVLAGEAANDVDLVTSMPLALALALLRPMFRKKSLKVNPNTGYCRLGGTPASGDPFIDLKMVCLDNLGTPNARFGADLLTDVVHRDFACNALYYDPKNRTILDPTAQGLPDVEERRLTLISDRRRISSIDAAKIAIRFIKFMSRGYRPHDNTLQTVKTQYISELASLPRSQVLGYTRTQILSKYERASWPERLANFRDVMSELGHAQEWNRYFAPALDGLLGGAT